jgi:hypothetical protein
MVAGMVDGANVITVKGEKALIANQANPVHTKSQISRPKMNAPARPPGL